MTHRSKVCIVSDAIPPVHSGAGLSAMKLACRLHQKKHLGLILIGISDYLIRSGTDGFILPNDPANYAEKIRMLANDPQARARISTAAAEKASASFNEDRIDRTYMHLYRQIHGLQTQVPQSETVR